MQLQVRGGARRTTAALSLLIPASSPLFPSRSSPVTSRYLPPSLPPSLGASRQASVPPPRPFLRRPRTAPSPPPSASHQVSSALSAVGCAPLQGGLRGSSLVRQARPRAALSPLPRRASCSPRRSPPSLALPSALFPFAPRRGVATAPPSLALTARSSPRDISLPPSLPLSEPLGRPPSLRPAPSSADRAPRHPRRRRPHTRSRRRSLP